MAMLTTASTKTTPAHKMSYEDYLNLASDAQISEWVNGEIVTYMPASTVHQNILLFLTSLLQSFVQFMDLGHVLAAPFEARLWPNGPAREPDLLFITNDQLPQLTDKRFQGGPALVVEVISPSSLTQDRVYKFAEYQQAGVGEYWLIDPRPYQQQADFFVRGEDGLFYAAAVDENGRYPSTILPHFWLELAWLWQDPMPNPQLAFAQIMLTIDTLPSESKTTFQSLYHLLANKK